MRRDVDQPSTSVNIAMTAWWLLLGASGLLLGLIILAVVVLRFDSRVRRIRLRREFVVASFKPKAVEAQASVRLIMPRSTASLARQLKVLLGMDLLRRDSYPIRMIVIIPSGLIVGLIVRWFLHGLFGVLSWAMVPLVCLYTTRAVHKSLDAKRAATLYRQFPDALATIVRAVRVGIPVTEAIRAVSIDAEFPTSVEFSRLHDQVGIGAPLEEALREMATRNRLPEYRFFATALALQSQTGGGLTETLENLADVVRKRVALKARGYALAAEARTSAGILAALPVFSGVALLVINPRYIAPLFEEGPGQTLFGCGVVWLGLGIMVMRGLIRKSLA